MKYVVIQMGIRSIKRNIQKNNNATLFNSSYNNYSAGFNDGYLKGLNEGLGQAGELMFIMTAYTLEYKLELTQEKLVQIMTWIYSNVDSFRTGQLTTEDFFEIKKEMEQKGIKYKRSK